MPTRSWETTGQKVFYRPIEAGIRWSGLLAHEQRILEVVGTRPLLEPNAFPEWPALHLNTERIVDALVNGDLVYGKNGITCHDPTLIDSPDLTVRHVDLKAWMADFYPGEKPAFLFSGVERRLHTAISAEAVQALLADHEALKIRLAHQTEASKQLQSDLETLHQKHEADVQRTQRAQQPSRRSESTYLNIVAGLLTLLLGHSPSGHPYSSFNTQDAVISAMIAHHGDRLGISQSTLENKFAKAKQHMQGN
ncbi:hypothetical protein [Salinisphaera hydrothermalis]|uniref:Receptor protein-tyrosine kinase n=1 Tax=Salinisphaera hydrothermalis (strain C41B8) TaxID=1304275 RepID=A0A084INF4_SALHC|nr:hypothetical protein [Salinisphaera hydrothermalis]KEZ78238.1 hypothetical protein C41B8_06622 [Salinisphaera hydrothermalis C41B8]